MWVWRIHSGLEQAVTGTAGHLIEHVGVVVALLVKADVILTSMLKEVGNSFVAFFHQVEAGEDVWGKGMTLGYCRLFPFYPDDVA